MHTSMFPCYRTNESSKASNLSIMEMSSSLLPCSIRHGTVFYILPSKSIRIQPPCQEEMQNTAGTTQTCMAAHAQVIKDKLKDTRQQRASKQQLREELLGRQCCGWECHHGLACRHPPPACRSCSWHQPWTWQHTAGHGRKALVQDSAHLLQGLPLRLVDGHAKGRTHRKLDPAKSEGQDLV